MVVSFNHDWEVEYLLHCGETDWKRFELQDKKPIRPLAAILMHVFDSIKHQHFPAHPDERSKTLWLSHDKYRVRCEYADRRLQ